MSKKKKRAVNKQRVLVTAVAADGSLVKYYLKRCEPIRWTKHRKEAYNYFPDFELAGTVQRELLDNSDAPSSLPPGSYEICVEVENILATVVSRPFNFTGLTPRQRQVVSLRLGGLQVKEIASQLNLDTETVNTHLDAVFAKRGLKGRGALKDFMSLLG